MALGGRHPGSKDVLSLPDFGRKKPTWKIVFSPVCLRWILREQILSVSASKKEVIKEMGYGRRLKLHARMQKRIA